jgi:hypothetical protein
MVPVLVLPWPWAALAKATAEMTAAVAVREEKEEEVSSSSSSRLSSFSRSLVRDPFFQADQPSWPPPLGSSFCLACRAVRARQHDGPPLSPLGLPPEPLLLLLLLLRGATSHALFGSSPEMSASSLASLASLFSFPS